jgi:hypothetical protein
VGRLRARRAAGADVAGSRARQRVSRPSRRGFETAAGGGRPARRPAGRRRQLLVHALSRRTGVRAVPRGRRLSRLALQSPIGGRGRAALCPGFRLRRPDRILESVLPAAVRGRPRDGAVERPSRASRRGRARGRRLLPGASG